MMRCLGGNCGSILNKGRTLFPVRRLKSARTLPSGGFDLCNFYPLSVYHPKGNNKQRHLFQFRNKRRCCENISYKASVYAASTVEVKPQLLCVPSQKGILLLCPQRQSESAVLPSVLNCLPFSSKSSNSPSKRIGPLFLMITFVGIVLVLVRCEAQ